MTVSGLVEASASGLGIRFGLVGLLPTTLLAMFVLALVGAGAPAQAPNLRVALDKIAQYDTAQGFLLVIVILALALVLQPFQLLLVRLLEGYWGTSKLARVLSALFVKRHIKERDRLQAKLDALLQSAQGECSTEGGSPLAAEAGQLSERIARFYPNRRLLPTALGNVLRAAEENAGAPYGLDVITIWPRLYALLPKRTADVVDDQRNQLDIASRFCVTFGPARSCPLDCFIDTTGG